VSAFFDTNILVYAQQTGTKADRARALFEGGGKLSVQVLNEFTAVSRRKQARDWREIDEAVSDVLAMVDPLLALTLDLHAQRERSPNITGSLSMMR
jgi:predicted nucleic acid-binding protein